MRVRGRYLPLAAVAGAFLAMGPAVASSETSPTVEAVNTGLYTHAWSPAQVTVGAGGAVSLRNPTTASHGVEWVGGPAKPECSSGVPVGTSAAASGKEWSGTCTFAQAGTYTFYCTVHGPEMTATVTVSANGTTTAGTTATSTGATPTTASPTAPASGSPLLGAPLLRPAQHGGSVHGSLAISQAGAGDRLEVDLLASRGALGSAGHAGRVRVARLVRGSVSAGTLLFVVKLDAAAHRALERRHRLSLVARIELTPLYGSPSIVTRTVTVHS